jgi:hypothetical protein
MLVYGDHVELADPAERLRAIGGRLARVAAMPRGLDRHAALVGALVEAGQLQQGVEDLGEPSAALAALVHSLAAAVVRSLDSGFVDCVALPPVPALDLPGEVELRVPEGFAFYAVYPEAYAAAARRLRLAGPPRVIGIRSIGTTLGAIVAAALGARPAATVRPLGDPFARQVELPSGLDDDRSHFVIVDEGPGLSGSSFGAVADALEQRGVPLERIAFLPSHGGDFGPQASAAHRERWARAQRVPAEFRPEFLTHEFGPLEPFSTGGAFERLKFLATRDGGERLLLKFAGLGAIGERKLGMARALHAAGFTPEPIGLVHGFIAERWRADARPLAQGDSPVEAIGRYIGARARLFPAASASGASIEELVTMCRRNIGLAMGGEAAATAERHDAGRLSSRIRPVRTDNKLDREEWLRTDHGRLLKTDALDHHQAHDLVGCQDAAWDVAGAIVEFELDQGQARTLIAATGLQVDAELLRFYRLAYSAFRLGQAVLADRSAGRGLDEERYARALRQLLAEPTRVGNRRECLVD